MGDFFQNGRITTLHNLATRTLEDMEEELINFSHIRPMGLILPSLYSELERPALTTIVDELEKVKYLSQIVIGIDQADKDEFRHAIKFFSRLPQQHNLLWNDGPNLREIDAKLRK